MGGPYYPKRRYLGRFIGAPIAKVLKGGRWRTPEPDLPGGWRAHRWAPSYTNGVPAIRFYRPCKWCQRPIGDWWLHRAWWSASSCECHQSRTPDVPRDPREPRHHRDEFVAVTTWLGRFLARVVARAVGVRHFDGTHYSSEMRDAFGREVATFLPILYAELVNVAAPHLEGFPLDTARRSIAYAARRLADPRCLARWRSELARGDRAALTWIARIARRHPGAGEDVFPMFAPAVEK